MFGSVARGGGCASDVRGAANEDDVVVAVVENTEGLRSSWRVAIKSNFS
jgi:hypothetical protein